MLLYTLTIVLNLLIGVRYIRSLHNRELLGHEMLDRVSVKGVLRGIFVGYKPFGGGGG